MNILAMDTSNQILGAALLRDGALAASYITNVKRNHSVRLMPAVERMMQDIDMTPAELDQIVVANGPGSYTGIRIGVTTAKTLAWTLDIPVKMVSSLEMLAWQARDKEQKICSFFDARRGLVYAGLYTFVRGASVAIGQEQNMLMKDLLHQLKEASEPVIFLSPDMAVHREDIETIMGELAVIPDQTDQYPNPADLAFCSLQKEATPLDEVVPSYLRLAEAEAKWMNMNGEKNRHE